MVVIGFVFVFIFIFSYCCLPYRDESNTLLFTGEFVGVYFPEELKHALKKGVHL